MIEKCIVDTTDFSQLSYVTCLTMFTDRKNSFEKLVVNLSFSKIKTGILQILELPYSSNISFEFFV